MLLRKLIGIAFVLALALAALMLWGIEQVRATDRALAIERTALAFQTDLVRARCEANPKWFLAGPRENAPSAELLAHPDADVLAPRPDSDPRPVEFFAYDIELIGQSPAAPRLTNTMRARLRMDELVVTESFTTSEGTGAQTVVATRWDGPCAFLLFRMHPPPHQWRQRVTMYGALAGGVFVVTMMVAWPIDRRIRRMGAQMRASARTEYREPASVGGRDELSQLGFAFNEAGLDIHRLHTDFRDRDVDYRRLIGYLGADSEAVLRSALATADARMVADALRLSNVVIGSHLRESPAPSPIAVDVSTVVTAVVGEFRSFAATRQVVIDVVRCDAGVSAQGQPAWLTQALRNILALALEREPRGGRIEVALGGSPQGGFVCTVVDTGPNLPDDDLRKLNAVRRFRGDEGRGADLRGDIGLGLAIVHEVSHRFELQLVFNRPVTGGLEVRLQSAG